MTLEVAAGTTDCFYLDNVKSGQTIDFEYQVRSGQHRVGHKNMD